MVLKHFVSIAYHLKELYINQNYIVQNEFEALLCCMSYITVGVVIHVRFSLP